MWAGRSWDQKMPCEKHYGQNCDEAASLKESLERTMVMSASPSATAVSDSLPMTLKILLRMMTNWMG